LNFNKIDPNNLQISLDPSTQAFIGTGTSISSNGTADLYAKVGFVT